MARQLVFVPVKKDELEAMLGNATLRHQVAYRVTNELLETMGLDPKQTEEAEYAALLLASVAALAVYGRRLVLVAEVHTELITPGSDTANGECLLANVPTGAITCWFSEEPGADFTAAAAACQGKSLDEAWAEPALQLLLSESDLLWNDVVEYRN